MQRLVAIFSLLFFVSPAYSASISNCGVQWDVNQGYCSHDPAVGNGTYYVYTFKPAYVANFGALCLRTSQNCYDGITPFCSSGSSNCIISVGGKAQGYCASPKHWDGSACVDAFPQCVPGVNDASCMLNGHEYPVGDNPGEFDPDYGQVVPTCPEGEIYILGACRPVPLGLAALGTLGGHTWERLADGTWVATSEAIAEHASDFERLLAQETGAMSEFERLLAADGKTTVSEFERLLAKDAFMAEGRIAAAAGILARAAPVLNAAALGYAAWELYDYGRVMMDSRETQHVLGGCPSGFSGSDCGTQTGQEMTWPADNKPTYIYQPNNPTQPYIYHPRDPDRSTYDLTQTSPGKWEFVSNPDGSTSDYYFAPTTEGPVLISRTQNGPTGGRVVTIQAGNKGDIRIYRPDPNVRPTLWTAPGDVIIVDPLMAPSSECTSGNSPRGTLTPPQQIVCRRQQPKPLSDPAYQPYPNPMQQPDPDPDTIKVPLPLTQPQPEPYTPPQTEPQPGTQRSPYKVPNITPSPPTAPQRNNKWTNSSCGCDLDLPQFSVPTLAETTDKLIEDMADGIGVNTQPPTMSGQCPEISIDFNGEEHGVFSQFGVISTDAHCQILEENRVFINAVSVLLATITALLIVFM